MRIIELSVFYRTSNPVSKLPIGHEKLFIKGRETDTRYFTESPEYQDIEHIKLQVGRMVKTIVDVAEYYYVVVGIEKANGGKGYRTIIPKTVVA